jgi:hypothetical protein
MKYSKGICWIGDCRIPFVDEPDPSAKRYQSYRNVDNLYGGYGDTHNDYKEQQGRFTPNLLVCDDMLNDGVITKQSKRTYKPTENMGSLFGNSPQAHGVGIGDSGSSSRYYDLDKWFDKIIDSL